MSVRRLLSEMDSYELSAWLAFLKVDADVQKERRKRAQEDKALLGDDDDVVIEGS